MYPKHVFINLRPFLSAFEGARMLNLTGMLRSGKTLFSVALAWHLKVHGMVTNTVFNFPCAFGDAFRERKNTYVVLDEAGRLFDNRTAYKDKDLNKILTESIWSLGKDGSYVAYPSFLDVDVKLRQSSVRCWRSWPKPPPPGEKKFQPLWFYRWEFGEEEVEKRNAQNFDSGFFWFFYPQAFWGAYDTWYQPGSDELKLFAQRVSKG